MIARLPPLLCLLAGLALGAAEPTPAAPVVMWDLPHLEAVRKRIQAGDAAPAAALARLRREADQAAQGPAVAVTDKTAEAAAPSGNAHDYVSFSTYYWPDAKDPTAPWVKKDGAFNQAMINRYDQPRLRKMATRVTDCALAWWFTGERRHAVVAVEQLRTWFLDDATRMAPHLDYAQFVPNRDGGRGNAHGVIDTRSFCAMLSAVALLETGDVLTTADRLALREWFRSFIGWLTTSRLGLGEAKATNNHGVFYDQQLIAYALYVGDTTLARSVLDRFGPRRLATQIEPDGSTPAEQTRADGATYTVFNLVAMAQIMAMGRQGGVDLWAWKTADGRSLHAAVDWLAPYMDGKPWAFSGTFSLVNASDLFWIIASTTGDSSCLAVARRHAGDPANRRNLLYPLPEAPPGRP